MILSKLFPRHMRADRPGIGATVELTDDYIRRALKIPPAAHAEANEAQFEQLLVSATPADLRNMVRDLRKRLAGAEFAARTNADTVRAMWRRENRE
jgi:hypothetical protein